MFNNDIFMMVGFLITAPAMIGLIIGLSIALKKTQRENEMLKRSNRALSNMYVDFTQNAIKEVIAETMMAEYEAKREDSKNKNEHEGYFTKF